jgi:signal transduction histidine kinase
MDDRPAVSDDWMRNWQRSIAVKISAVVMYAVIMLSFVGSVLYLRGAEGRIRRDYVADAELFAYDAATAAHASRASSRDQVLVALDLLRLKRAVPAVSLRVGNGTILLGTLPSGAFGVAPALPLPDGILAQAGGTASMTVHFAPLRDVVNRMRARFFLIAGGSGLLFGFFLTAVIRRFIAKPVNELVRATAIISRGDYRHRLTIPGTDELGYLADFINRMLDRILGELTERRQAEEDLQKLAARLDRSNRELERFLTIAAHDLQEPLRKIQTLGERLLATVGDGLTDKGRDYLDRMRGASNRMQALIDDLRSFTRVTERKRTFASVDLGAVIQKVVADQRERIDAAHGRVEVGTLPTVSADTMEMRELFRQLIDNAMKYRKDDADPVIRIAAMPPSGGNGSNGHRNGMCTITVEDNGFGFDDRHAEWVFGVFQRLHGGEKYGGNGIGLAICRKIAEAHAGSITASSEPGRGTTISVTLPALQEEGGGHGKP